MLYQRITQTKKILIVEDDKKKSLCLKRQLEKQNFIVYQDFTRTEAIIMVI